MYQCSAEDCGFRTPDPLAHHVHAPRNRVCAPDPDYPLPTPVARQRADGAGPARCIDCTNILTIADRGAVCRQCRRIRGE